MTCAELTTMVGAITQAAAEAADDLTRALIDGDVRAASALTEYGLLLTLAAARLEEAADVAEAERLVPGGAE